MSFDTENRFFRQCSFCSLLKKVETTHEIVFIGFTDWNPVSINDTGIFLERINFLQLHNIGTMYAGKI